MNSHASAVCISCLVRSAVANSSSGKSGLSNMCSLLASVDRNLFAQGQAEIPKLVRTRKWLKRPRCRSASGAFSEAPLRQIGNAVLTERVSVSNDAYTALATLRRYHQAQETQPAEEVEKLRLEAEALFVAVNEYQRQAFGGPAPQFH